MQHGATRNLIFSMTQRMQPNATRNRFFTDATHATLCNIESGFSNVSAKGCIERGPRQLGIVHDHTKPNAREFATATAVTLLLG
jgi:hypothetical protein